MKTNKAPEKIYINPMPNPSDGYVGVAWDEPHKTMVEYIRTDAFIEKACEWLKFNYTEYTNNTRLGIKIDELIKDFKQAMEE